MSEALLEARELKKYFPVREGFFGRNYLRAVDGVDLHRAGTNCNSLEHTGFHW